MCDLEQLIVKVKFLCSIFSIQKKIAVTKQTKIHCRFRRVQDTAPLIPGHWNLLNLSFQDLDLTGRRRPKEELPV